MLTSAITAGLNSGKLCTKTHDPLIHGAKTLLQAAFTQPVSEVFHIISEGVKFIQYLIKQRGKKMLHTVWETQVQVTAQLKEMTGGFH